MDSSSDHLTGAYWTTHRWSAIISILMYVILRGSSNQSVLSYILILPVVYVLSCWLLTRYSQAPIVRYTRSFETCAPRLVCTLLALFAASLAIMVCIEIFLSGHPEIQFNALPAPVLISGRFTITVSVLAALELLFCVITRLRQHTDSHPA